MMSAGGSNVLGAAHAGLASCGSCGLLARPASATRVGHCPRCGEPLAWRRAHAVQRTWALLIAAAVLYVPANVLPVLTTKTLGSSQADTILSGVMFLYETGSWPLALIVLVASVMIPLGKIAALGYVLVSVQRGSATNNRQRTRLYRIVEFIGRWSMLDVFVDTFVVALVQLAPIMSVEPGPGVVYFMAVVVLTMLAAQSFDPRLIWDAATMQKRRTPPKRYAPPPLGARRLGTALRRRDHDGT
jgi:paraquat-inducible protein A